MSQKELALLKQKVHSSRLKHVYSALVEVRTKWLKQRDGETRLLQAGLVPRFLQLLQLWNISDDQSAPKVVDVSLSILGNLCMKDTVRREVVKENGIPIICNLLCEADSKSIQNRCGRCLANIALLSSAWEAIHASEAVETIVKLLKDTDDDECQQTFIRAIRLLGQTRPLVQKLLDVNAVSTVMSRLASESTEVQKFALRCVSSLAVHGCNMQLASQVITSGMIGQLLTFLDQSDADLVHTAFTLVFHLLEQWNFRPAFGNAGGILLFLGFLKEDRHQAYQMDIMNGLCLCCKEAVNRVKLRDGGTLQLILDWLSDGKRTQLHVRLVSCLICFLYDDVSFDLLLDHGLVRVLLAQLHQYMELQARNAGKESDLEFVGLGRKVVATETLEGQQKDSSCSDTDEPGQDLCQDKPQLSEEKDESHQSQTLIVLNPAEPKIAAVESSVIKTNETEASIAISCDLGQSSEVEKPEEEHLQHQHVDSGSVAEATEECCRSVIETADRCYSELVSTEQNSTESADKKDQGDPLSRPMYSIDSPTYQATSAWEWDDLGSSVTCKESFTPPHLPDSHATQLKNYSPISNVSYYSPSQSSPEYSPQYSPPYNHPTTPRTGRQIPRYLGMGSPGRSPSPLSDTGDLDMLGGAGSSKDLKENNSSLLEARIGLSDSTHIDEPTFSPEVSDEEDEAPYPETKAAETESENESTTSTGSAGVGLNTDQDSITAASKTGNLRHGPGNTVTRKRKIPSHSSVMENNILTLLSRVSQMTNPTIHLVTSEFLESLLHYIAGMELPMARAARLLSRIFRNPLCFEELMKLNLPLLVYKQLLEDEDVSELFTEFRRRRRTDNSTTSPSSLPSMRQLHRADSSNSLSSDSGRFSLTDESIDSETSQPMTKRRRGSEDSTGSDGVMFRSLPGLYHKQTDQVCDPGKCGLAFLEDLSGVVESPYGRGIIQRLWHCGNDQQRQSLSVSLLFILWSRGARQYYFSTQVMTEVLSVLEQRSGAESQLQFQETVQGLSFLAKAMGLTVTPQCLDSGQLLRQFTAAQAGDRANQSAVAAVAAATGTEGGSSPSCRLADTAERQLKNEVMGASSKDTGPVSGQQAFPPCCLREAQCDVQFMVAGSKLPAVKSVLVKQSEIFSAMLEGHYTESSLSEIPIPNTSSYAFNFILHYLHGCSPYCPVINDLLEGQASKVAAEHCIEALNEANKYLLLGLKSVLEKVLQSRVLSPESSLPVFQYAVLHDSVSLQVAAAVSVLVECCRPHDVCHFVLTFLKSLHAAMFLQTLSEIFTNS